MLADELVQPEKNTSECCNIIQKGYCQTLLATYP